MAIFDVIKYPIDTNFRSSDLENIPQELIEVWIKRLRDEKVCTAIITFYMIRSDYDPSVIEFFFKRVSEEKQRQAVDIIRAILYNHDDI